MHTEAIDWTDDGAVRLLDQTLLPDETRYRVIETTEDMVEAIAKLRVRGAPLIGIAAAMGLAAAATRRNREGGFATATEALEWLGLQAEDLTAARPTAVNLCWAVERVVAGASQAVQASGSTDAGSVLATVLRDAAQALWDEDAAMCRAIGEAGAARIPSGSNVLTICNTGMLATGGIGTAFGVLRVAHEQGRLAEVVACETRPLRQGARLTAWELARARMPGTVIVDSAAATVMDHGRVDVVIAGADRIARNGDAANKIGTLALAHLAHAYNLPFYIAAPRSTIDPEARSAEDIPIEERSASEIGMAKGVAGYNPAFDVTPARLITGIITDVGVLEPPYAESLTRALEG